MTPLCQITFVALLISVVNLDLFLNSRHLYDSTGTLVSYILKIKFIALKNSYFQRIYYDSLLAVKH